MDDDNIITRIRRLLGETIVAGDVEPNITKGNVTTIGVPKRDGSGKGVRANRGRGGCKIKKKKNSKLTGLLRR